MYIYIYIYIYICIYIYIYIDFEFHGSIWRSGPFHSIHLVKLVSKNSTQAKVKRQFGPKSTFYVQNRSHQPNSVTFIGLPGFYTYPNCGIRCPGAGNCMQIVSESVRSFPCARGHHFGIMFLSGRLMAIWQEIRKITKFMNTTNSFNT